MLVDQLRDAHSAERQAIQMMKKTLRKVSAQELRQGLEAHIQQSEEQRERVEQALEQMGAKAGRKVCEAMRGLAEEAQHEMDEHDKGPLLDLVIVASQQRIEHYEIAAYGTMAELARAMGEEQVADLMGQTLEEEKRQDELLTELTRERLLPLVMESMQDGDDEEDEDELEEDDEEEEAEEEDEAKAGAPARGSKTATKPAPSRSRKSA